MRDEDVNDRDVPFHLLPRLRPDVAIERVAAAIEIIALVALLEDLDGEAGFRQGYRARRALARPVAADERWSGRACRDHAARNRRPGAPGRRSAVTNAF